jgi:hypothetical protein
VDTSQFYTKAESDSRFLGLHGTADNSLALGLQSQGDFLQTENAFSAEPGVTSTGTYTDDVSAGTSDIVYPVQLPRAGTLTASCSDPAGTTTLHYAFATGSTGSVQIQQGTTAHYYDTPPVADVSVGGVGGEVSYVIAYANGTISWIDAFVTSAPGGRNLCRVRTFYQRFVPTP